MTTDNDELNQRLQDTLPIAQAVCRALQDEVGKLGLEDGAVTIAAADVACFSLERDPASGAHALIGEWRDGSGNKFGSLVFHADGSFFVEHDVVRVHPTRPSWFVEAVIAWGRGQDVRSEARLLAMAS